MILLQTKGELHPERKEAFEKSQKAYEKLLANTSSLAVSIEKKFSKAQLLFSDVHCSVTNLSSKLIFPMLDGLSLTIYLK